MRTFALQASQLLDSSPFSGGGPARHLPPSQVAPPLAEMSKGVVSLDEVENLAGAGGKHLWHKKDPPIDAILVFDTLRGKSKPEPVETILTKRRYTKRTYDSHLAQLDEWGKIRTIPMEEDPPLYHSSPFYVRVKAGVDLSRPIWGAVEANASMAPPPYLRMPTLRETIDWTFEKEGELYAVSIDMKGWFGEIPIAGNYLRISHRGKEIWAWTVLPQGWSWSPCLAQRISEMILSGLSTTGIIYDNFLLCDSLENLQEQVRIFLQRTKRVNAEINMEKSILSPSREVVYCGVSLNLKTRCYRSETKWATKAGKALAALSKCRRVTYEEVYRAAGLANWALTTRRVPFCYHRPILSALRVVGRRLYRGERWTSMFELSDALSASLATIALTLAQNKWQQWQQRGTTLYTLYCDACDSGFAWILFKGDKIVKHWQQQWDRDLRDVLVNIAEKETHWNMRKIISTKKRRVHISLSASTT